MFALREIQRIEGGVIVACIGILYHACNKQRMKGTDATHR
jgi:hypothetical protein